MKWGNLKSIHIIQILIERSWINGVGDFSMINTRGTEISVEQPGHFLSVASLKPSLPQTSSEQQTFNFLSENRNEKLIIIFIKYIPLILRELNKQSSHQICNFLQ